MCFLFCFNYYYLKKKMYWPDDSSFSKLKLLKTYLRSTMSQERLNGLALMSINQEVAKLNLA